MRSGHGGFFFFSSRRRHTRFDCDWSSDVCSSDLGPSRTVPRNTHVPPHSGDETVASSSRSEEHTSELQSQSNLVCRLLLEKKKKIREDSNAHDEDSSAMYDNQLRRVGDGYHGRQQ